MGELSKRALSIINETAWTRGHGKHGPMITLEFNVPAVQCSHFVACYYGESSEDEARATCRLVADEWAAQKIEVANGGQ